MADNFPRTLAAGAALLAALCLAAPPAYGQATTDLVVTVGYYSVKPEQANAWAGVFKKHLKPALDQLQQEGALPGWHLFVPSLHHPGATWTHALVLGNKDRAAQGLVEKKLQEVLAAMPAADAKMLVGAIDREKHFDDEWREVNWDAVTVPEDKKEEEKK